MSDEKQGSKKSFHGPRKRFSMEIRESALRLIKDHGLTNKQVAERFGCTEETVRRWRLADKCRQMSSDESQSNQVLIAELRSARKEIARLQMEAEFLKKAAAYFAKESK